MRRGFGFLLAATALAACAVDSAWLSPPSALACGGVFTRRLWKDERRPSLAYEQTLIIHDADKGREHFIREVTFRASKQAFGFVVPTPNRPKVDAVLGKPFDKLRAMFPFRSLDEEDRKDEASKKQLKAAGGARGGQVTVLEQKKVGSFTSFVLAANDDKALKGWLTQHDLESTPEADVWLAHYVAMGFFFVAMRYDPPPGVADSETTQSEVVRFSFDTPLAYYPYLEPARKAGLGSGEDRMLEVWLVTQRAAVPVAAQTESGKTRWVRPFAEGRSYERQVRSDLGAALGLERSLLYEGPMIVQRFIDQKSVRTGFGDVLFVPASKPSFDDATRQRIALLLPVLDPTLAPTQAPGRRP